MCVIANRSTRRLRINSSGSWSPFLRQFIPLPSSRMTWVRQPFVAQWVSSVACWRSRSSFWPRLGYPGVAARQRVGLAFLASDESRTRYYSVAASGISRGRSSLVCSHFRSGETDVPSILAASTIFTNRGSDISAYWHGLVGITASSYLFHVSPWAATISQITETMCPALVAAHVKLIHTIEHIS